MTPRSAVKAALVVALGVVTPVRAELAWTDIASDDELLASGTAALVVTVVATADGTNEAPPKIEVKIDEVLFGKHAPAATTLEWGPRRCDCDSNTVKDPAAAIAKWKTEVIKGPAVGTKWIVSVNGTRVAIRPRLAFSAQKREQVKAALERIARERAAQKKQ
ncbi:MAG: hypothetical protein U0228_33450 [Myxococcaceae bacterium]